MKEKGILAVLVAILLAQSMMLAQDNPFTSEKPKSGIQYPAFIKKFIKYTSSAQRTLNHRMADLSKEIKEKRSVKPLLVIFVITFVYGMVHALGPGHGKTITTSYFLAEQAEIKKGIMVGILIGFLHALSALVLVLVLYFVIKQAFLTRLEDFGKIVKMISYGSISIIGLVMLFRAIVSIWRKKRPAGTTAGQNSVAANSIIPFAIAVGLTPCSGAIIMLLFSISLGVLYLGIASIFFMALGMALTISMVGVVTILAKKNLMKFMAARARISRIFQAGFSVTGALLIALLGILLFTSAL